MKQQIDCLILGYNETSIEEDEILMKSMGVESGAYRELNFSYIQHEGKLYTTSGIYNKLNPRTESSLNPMQLSTGDTFSSAISYLGTYLKKREYSFDYINSFKREKEELKYKLQNDNIQAIAITTTFYISHAPICEIISFIREYNQDVKIIVGGPFVASSARKYDYEVLNRIFKLINADFYINSPQGEYALAKLIGAIKDNRPYGQIDNIYYKEGKKFIASPISKEDNKLDDNMVEWDLYKKSLNHKSVAVRTAISCPYSCSFCAYPEHAGEYRTAGIDSVERELDSLECTGRVESVNFIDDTFNIPPDRFKNILRMMIKKKYNFKWHSYFRCQFADRETVELMKESGCEGVFLGIESGNQQILKSMNKAATIEKYKMGLELLSENDIITYASFIVGFPGETLDSVQDTVRFIEEYKPTFYRANLWYADPSTPIWSKKDQYNIIGSQYEWSHNTMNSKTACDLIDEMFLTIKSSCWLPLYNFDFQGIFHLIHRGMDINQVKEYIHCFNLGVKQKLENKTQREVNADTIAKLKKSLSIGI
ncbi:MAG: PhpK family radical SAM P-methyltransferase [Ruminiclostridium sp.]